MKAFPETGELKFLLGLTVRNAILQPYSIDFTFDDGTFLIVEEGLEHVYEDGRSYWLNPQEEYGPVDLHRIVNRQIVSLEREPFMLTLTFDNGHMMRIISTPGIYESGHFSRQGDVVVF